MIRTTGFTSLFKVWYLMKKYLSCGLIAIALAACDTQKIPITGTRVPVVNYENSVKVDADTKNMSVTLPLPEMGRDWPQVGGGSDHVMPHLSLKENLEPLWTVS